MEDFFGDVSNITEDFLGDGRTLVASKKIEWVLLLVGEGVVSEVANILWQLRNM